MQKTAQEKQEVRDAFRRIAGRYDLMNALCSFGIERWWRRRAVAALEVQPASYLLDLCAGTLTVSADIVRAGRGVRVLALDFCAEMLLVGEERLSPEPEVLQRIDRVCAEGEAIPVREHTFDGAIVTYGVRNLADPRAGLAEMQRVLKPGARLVILEFTRPSLPFFRAFYHFYLGRIMPLIGAAVAGSCGAYEYLSTSIGAFMEPAILLEMLRDVGFEKPCMSRHTLGTVGLYRAQKPR